MARADEHAIQAWLACSVVHANDIGTHVIDVGARVRNIGAPVIGIGTPVPMSVMWAYMCVVWVPIAMIRQYTPTQTRYPSQARVNSKATTLLSTLKHGDMWTTLNPTYMGRLPIHGKASHTWECLHIYEKTSHVWDDFPCIRSLPIGEVFLCVG